MKNVVKIVVVAVVMFLTSTTNVNAQKVAHIDLDSLIGLMPESKTAQNAVQEYAKQLEEQVKLMQAEFEQKYTDYEAKKADWAPVIRQAKEKELQDLQQRIQDFQQQAQADYQRKTAELSKPVYDKAKKAIDAVAKESGYKYVLDTSTGLVIYHEATEDILIPVMKKLGIPVPAATTTTPQKK